MIPIKDLRPAPVVCRLCVHEESANVLQNQHGLKQAASIAEREAIRCDGLEGQYWRRVLSILDARQERGDL